MRRLKTRSQFQAVLAGDKVAATAHFVLHRCGCGGSAPVDGVVAPGPVPRAVLFIPDVAYLGAMVPKRWAKRAVTRNTIKRQIYHVSTQFESVLAASAHVVRLRCAFDRSRFPSATSEALKQAVREEVTQLFSRATRGNILNQRQC